MGFAAELRAEGPSGQEKGDKPNFAIRRDRAEHWNHTKFASRPPLQPLVGRAIDGLLRKKGLLGNVVSHESGLEANIESI